MRRLLGATVTALALLATGCAVTSGEPPSSTAPAQVTGQARAGAAAGVAAGARSSRAQARPAPGQGSTPAEDPRRLHGPAINAPVIPTPLAGDALVIPKDPDVLGWWGARAGAREGAMLLAGHTVQGTGGALGPLPEVRPGDTLRVGSHRYRVIQSVSISKETLARRAARLFSQDRAHRLVVVTCSGYDAAARAYDSNHLTIAVPLP